MTGLVLSSEDRVGTRAKVCTARASRSNGTTGIDSNTREDLRYKDSKSSSATKYACFQAKLKHRFRRYIIPDGISPVRVVDVPMVCYLTAEKQIKESWTWGNKWKRKVAFMFGHWLGINITCSKNQWRIVKLCFPLRYHSVDNVAHIDKSVRLVIYPSPSGNILYWYDYYYDTVHFIGM